MHSFEELVYRSTSFTLNALEEVYEKLLKELENSGSTSAVKNLQMLQLQKVILATGMFSIFDAKLQNALSVKEGFEEAKKILLQKDELQLHDNFQTYIWAINTLKHGKGRSYQSLIDKIETLPFIIKLPDQNFFAEGDVSEIDTLIYVDDKFVLECAEVIHQVSIAVEI